MSAVQVKSESTKKSYYKIWILSLQKCPCRYEGYEGASLMKRDTRKQQVQSFSSWKAADMFKELKKGQWAGESGE